jgi:hypothetical protein
LSAALSLCRDTPTARPCTAAAAAAAAVAPPAPFEEDCTVTVGIDDLLAARLIGGPRLTAASRAAAPNAPSQAAPQAAPQPTPAPAPKQVSKNSMKQVLAAAPALPLPAVAALTPLRGGGGGGGGPGAPPSGAALAAQWKHSAGALASLRSGAGGGAGGGTPPVAAAAKSAGGAGAGAGAGGGGAFGRQDAVPAAAGEPPGREVIEDMHSTDHVFRRAESACLCGPLGIHPA